MGQAGFIDCTKAPKLIFFLPPTPTQKRKKKAINDDKVELLCKRKKEYNNDKTFEENRHDDSPKKLTWLHENKIKGEHAYLLPSFPPDLKMKKLQMQQ